MVPEPIKKLKPKTPKILIIDDDPSITKSLQGILDVEHYETMIAHDGRSGLEMATIHEVDAVVTDLRMPGINGMDLIHTLHQQKPRLPIILITAHGTTDIAIRATQLGAFDYLLKPYDIPQLVHLVHKAVASYHMATKPVKLREDNVEHEAIIGSGRAMQSVYKDIGRFANKQVTVLIQGETGSGKELVARALFQYSQRAEKPFIAVNCAAIPDTLLESELFGHEKGAFTGADMKRIGRFEQASGGTVFLDEIGDLQMSTQVKLLRVLQEKTIQRVGSKQTIPVDVRVIAATHVNLEKAIEAKQFREDLFYRLNAVVIRLPPLHERKEDMAQLVDYFIRRYTRELELRTTEIKNDAIKFLESQPWPGNIRQLENTIRQALLECEGYTITIEVIEKIMEQGAFRMPNYNSNNPVDTASSRSVDSLVRDMLGDVKAGNRASALEPLTDILEQALYDRAIDLAGGNQAQAARWVGVSRLTMREKLQKFGLHPGKQ